MQKFVLKGVANVPWETVEAVGRDLMPFMKTPVFQLPFGLNVEEVVIVSFRAPCGAPVHGGVFSVFCGEVIELVLVDEANGVDTSRRPAYAAFEVSLRFGDLLFTRDGLIDRANWSVLEIGGRKEREPKDARDAQGIRGLVRRQYLKLLVPMCVGIERLSEQDQR